MSKFSNIIYPVIKPAAGLGLKVYFKKILFTNKDRIPDDRPVLLVSNHPTAFLEPVLYATLFDKPIYSLVRGNFFENFWARLGLESLNMIAIFRMRDGGVAGLRKNAMIFSKCYDLLSNGEYVMIMAEGFTKQQKRLAPLQKGAARIAFGAAIESQLENLCIVPLGANFTYHEEFRSEVMIEVGEPLDISGYLDLYRQNKKEAVQVLTKDIADLMKSTIVHINREEDDELFENVVRIVRRENLSSLFPVIEDYDERFRLEKSIADWLNNFSENEKAGLQKLVQSYPYSTVLRSHKKIGIYFKLLGLFPFWLLGSIYRMIPFGIARWIVNNHVNQVEFVSPMRYGMGMLFIIIWTLIICVFVGIFLGIGWIWLPFVLLVFIWISVLYDDIRVCFQQNRNWRKLKTSDRLDAIRIENELSDKIQELSFNRP
ncbi:MAG: 1-acyl-sn-glycerol-3-phosphate acyltransferase [Bacteroidia bacterium]|nr:1-acyl-sn-glycerol-3-phosphate acyltransferase [Bacteroidia bacterium]